MRMSENVATTTTTLMINPLTSRRTDGGKTPIE